MQSQIVVIGTSAGGVEALKSLLNALPKDFPAPILIVMHLSSQSVSYLPAILTRHSHLKINTPHAGQILEAANVYIAPPNYHMLLEKDKIQLYHGPRVNHCRPAIDPLFFSAAATYKSQVIGIILSGLLDDGSAGLQAIKSQQGITIVQDLQEAEYPDMPRNALKNVSSIDYCLNTKDIAVVLAELVKKSVVRTDHLAKNFSFEHELNMNKTHGDLPEEGVNAIGEPSEFACPDCQGVLWKMKNSDLVRFRCRVGHAYSFENLCESIDEEVENKLWAALRILEEKKSLLKLIIKKMSSDVDETRLLQQKLSCLNKQTHLLRSILENEQQNN